MTTLFLLFIISTGDSEPSFETLIEATGEAPYIAVVEKAPYSASLRFNPVWSLQAEALRALARDSRPDRAEVEKILAKGEAALSFVLKVGPHPDLPPQRREIADITRNVPSQSAYSANIKRLTYGMGGKFKIRLSDGTEIPAHFYHLERSWGIGHTNRFLVSFPATANGQAIADLDSLTVVFEDLHPELTELVFRFEVNPVKTAAIEPERICDALAKH